MLLKVSQESGLLLTTQASVLALPKLSKVITMLKGSQDFGHSKELPPLDLDLGREFKFHNIFICPVSKEVSDKSNPPMLLICGHVVSKNSLNKMVRQARTKIKCPTCPTEMMIEQAVELKIF